MADLIDTDSYFNSTEPAFSDHGLLPMSEDFHDFGATHTAGYGDYNSPLES